MVTAANNRVWLSVGEVADEFGFTPQTIRNWTKAASGPRLLAERIGKRHFRIHRSWVDEFIRLSNPNNAPVASVPEPRQSSSDEVKRYLRDVHGM